MEPVQLVQLSWLLVRAGNTTAIRRAALREMASSGIMGPDWGSPDTPIASQDYRIELFWGGPSFPPPLCRVSQTALRLTGDVSRSGLASSPENTAEKCGPNSSEIYLLFIYIYTVKDFFGQKLQNVWLQIFIHL